MAPEFFVKNTKNFILPTLVIPGQKFFFVRWKYTENYIDTFFAENPKRISPPLTHLETGSFGSFGSLPFKGPGGWRTAGQVLERRIVERWNGTSGSHQRESPAGAGTGKPPIPPIRRFNVNFPKFTDFLPIFPKNSRFSKITKIIKKYKKLSLFLLGNTQEK